ncbi:hypothetical protein [Neptunomonas japonica]|uniref:Uncharacterized protein n=1 Tax=Neptunomonas japonica JAMM 1380 TaxID=1441457 RepID=A0A7R6PC90_9GAMM|nr:hypothetical protein [Neptunomonas japonica]BBB31039.1 hypothetical protein NEJAP_3101 [Neptunomonas japonica JAMM 1380]
MIASQIFSSVGIGSLIGILLGLSSSPVVGLVVGSITALLASLIGLKTPATDDDSASQVLTSSQLKLAGIRTGSFGLACVLGIVVGIYMRTHNVLSPVEPTLEIQFNELTQIGFSPKEARDLLVITRFGNNSTAQEGEGSATMQSLEKTVLFATDSTLCAKIAVDRFESFAALMSFYHSLELNELSAMAVAINQHVSDDDTRMAIMKSTLAGICVPA